MSWEVSDGRKLKGQFASSRGFTDLRQWMEQQPAPHTQQFFQTGHTAQTGAVVRELVTYTSAASGDVQKTARMLALLIRHLASADITQGVR